METVQDTLAEEAIEIRGTVDRILFRDDASGNSILRIAVDGAESGGIVTVLGATLADEGTDVLVHGSWKHHPKFGRQVRATSIVAVRPQTPEAIERYLASGILPGVGEGIAKRIVAAFGAEALNVLDTDPERLLEVRGIGESKIDGIIAAWQAQKATQEIMLFLAGQGITPALAIRIYKTYGDKAIAIVRENPYRLAEDVHGVGFKIADAIAMRFGIPHDSPQRIAAGLRHLVDASTAHGHCGVPQEKLVELACQLLEVGESRILPVIDVLLLDSKRPIIRDTIPMALTCVFPGNLYQAETTIASRLAALAKRPSLWPNASVEAVDSFIRDISQKAGMDLASEQHDAVKAALTRRVSVLTGGPGTGKTATLNVVLAALHARKLRVTLGAPTGKAAKRMREATGHPAQTVARLIGMGTQNTPPIDCDMLVIDEASMVDVPMLQAVLQQLDDNAGLVLVGDVDQLPSVGPGRVLADIIEAGAVPVTRLTRIFRQAAQSAIVRNAHRINHGHALEDATPEGAPDPDFRWIEVADDGAPEEIVRHLLAEVTFGIPQRTGIASRDVQVLSPMRKSVTGADNLNAVLQKAINPRPAAFLLRGTTRFGIGDRVIQTSNNYDLEVMNGESGVIVGVDKEDGTLTVAVDDREVEYESSELDQLDLAYAMSVHKSQGSQFPAIVVPVTTQHYRMLLRPIFYTAITRATRYCVLIGQRRALQMAIRNDNMERRVTRLRPLLRNHSS